MRSAADMDEVGWPDFAAALARMESTRSCCPSSRRRSVSDMGLAFPSRESKTRRHSRFGATRRGA